MNKELKDKLERLDALSKIGKLLEKLGPAEIEWLADVISTLKGE